MDKKYRIMIAKVGCDIHERGALTMVNAFRDAGYEVIYTGRYQTEVGVVRAAVAEDVDLIAISDYTGSLAIISKHVMDAMKELDVNIPLICGGLMDVDDIKQMKELGVKGCYRTGSTVEECLNDVKEILV